MPPLEIPFDKKLTTGIAIGIGLALIVPVAITALAPVVRPLARTALRAGTIAYEKAREGVAEISEMTQDIVAEVHEEMREEREFEAAEAEVAETEAEETRESV